MRMRVDCLAIASLRDSDRRYLLFQRGEKLMPIGGQIKATRARTTELLRLLGGSNHEGALSFEIMDHKLTESLTDWFEKRSDRDTTVRPFLKAWLQTDAAAIDEIALKRVKEKFLGYASITLPQNEGARSVWVTHLFDIYRIEPGKSLERLVWQAESPVSPLYFATTREIQNLRTSSGLHIDRLATALLHPRRHLLPLRR